MADRVWRAAPPEALRVEPLGDLTAIFDRRSMQTHLVVAPMPEILTAMADGPCDAEVLAERLAAASISASKPMCRRSPVSSHMATESPKIVSTFPSIAA